MFYSCTKCLGSLGIIHNPMPDCHPASWAWLRDQVPELTTDHSFDSHATWVTDIDVLVVIHWHVTRGCLYNQTLADVCVTVQELDVCTVSTVIRGLARNEHVAFESKNVVRKVKQRRSYTENLQFIILCFRWNPIYYKSSSNPSSGSSCLLC